MPGDARLLDAAAVDAAIDAAMALLPVDEPASRRALLACFDTACTLADDTRQRLVAACMLLVIAAEFADFRGLPAWLARLRLTERADWPRCARPQDQARLDAGLLAASMLNTLPSADDPAVTAAAERLALALAGPLPVSPDERMLLWKCLFDCRAQCMDTVALTRIAAQAQDFLRQGQVTPRLQAVWWLLTAHNHDYFSAGDAAADALARARQLADEYGLVAIRYELLCVEMTVALSAEAWSRAEVIARDIEQTLPDIRAGRLPAGLRAQAWRLLCCGEPGAALLRLDRLLAICHDVEVPQRDRGAYHVLRAYALMALEHFDEARRVLEAQREHQRGDQGEILEALIGLATGLGEVHAGDPRGRLRLCDAVRRCAARQFDRFLLPLPALAAQVAEIALDAGVETEFIARTVRARKLVPADRSRLHWPWRLQVRVLGGLAVLRDGQPLPLSVKRPKKPLELLALLAAQGHAPLPVDQAIDTLWPSLDAEAPKASLEVALARLRKLLDVPGAVLLADGGLRLDLRMVWTDVAAFDTLAQRCLAGTAAAGAQPTAAQAPAHQALAPAHLALTIYRGALLAGDTVNAPWQRLREQLARRYSRLVVEHGAMLEAQQRWRDAAAVYEQAIAGDVLGEPFYRALMRVQLQLGERAEALRTFARCRDLLVAAFGVGPAPETCALRAQALGATSVPADREFPDPLVIGLPAHRRQR